MFKAKREEGEIERIKYAIKKLTDRRDYLERIVAALPEGKLICTQNGTYTKWYISNRNKSIYLPKRERNLAEELAYKNYCAKMINVISRKIDVLWRCLRALEKIETSSQLFLSTGSEQATLLKGYLHNYSEESQQWLEEECEYSKNYPEHLIHNTLDGHVVRSKSEVMIANALYHNKVPYKYECGIYLDGVQYFPDFTLFHPKKQQKMYWEHFGMMDVPIYCEKTYSKLSIYGNHAIIPTINLITTYETQEHPLDSMKIQHIIEEYFC